MRYSTSTCDRAAYAVPCVTAAPKPVPIDPFRESCRAMDKAVLKVDHFEAIYRLKKEIEGDDMR